MSLRHFFQKAFYRSRVVARGIGVTLVVKPWLRMQGMSIGRGVALTTLIVNWPHKVAVGDGCLLEPGIFFKFDGVWSPGKAIEIGERVFVGRGTEFNIVDHLRIASDALIGSGCKFVDHDHGIEPDRLIGPQPLTHAPISIGAGAWLGANVIVLQGVTIGDGAVIGAGSIVNRAVPAQEIWAGIPARRVGSRKR